ncbi:hypothetical protein MVLG_01740 [Microbotryum lychnidis-dioicae p1A1 Lamole]|uniref:Uncharacterized protein n=1 Tax=Microbotryum lychnidis-dioicae (strain p1A1 Lamole / MvSl-1064) TaxID=683840 RepID=U5H313_USTV1|nr:hypothetical protein MVLG_01740 [Microbotryum lychnidis-dioicae p1A1 Lamole]|eukprot:KDE08039.1 hypothetical protein MVLG_01740 [Microbotryum lychnidis-dioicae p1A1 Lamole]
MSATRAGFTAQDYDNAAAFLKDYPQQKWHVWSVQKALSIAHPEHTQQSWHSHWRAASGAGAAELSQRIKKLREAERQARKKTTSGDAKTSSIASTSKTTGSRLKGDLSPSDSDHSDDSDDYDDSDDDKSNLQAARKTKYTRQDLYNLIREIHTITKSGGLKRDIYVNLATKYPVHSATSWQTYHRDNRAEVDKWAKNLISGKKTRRDLLSWLNKQIEADKHRNTMSQGTQRASPPPPSAARPRMSNSSLAQQEETKPFANVDRKGRKRQATQGLETDSDDDGDARRARRKSDPARRKSTEETSTPLVSNAASTSNTANTAVFTDADERMLVLELAVIENEDRERSEAWPALAKKTSRHTAHRWKEYFTTNKIRLLPRVTNAARDLMLGRKPTVEKEAAPEPLPTLSKTAAASLPELAPEPIVALPDSAIGKSEPQKSALPATKPPGKPLVPSSSLHLPAAESATPTLPAVVSVSTSAPSLASAPAAPTVEQLQSLDIPPAATTKNLSAQSLPAAAPKQRAQTPEVNAIVATSAASPMKLSQPKDTTKSTSPKTASMPSLETPVPQAEDSTGRPKTTTPAMSPTKQVAVLTAPVTQPTNATTEAWPELGGSDTGPAPGPTQAGPSTQARMDDPQPSPPTPSATPPPCVPHVDSSRDVSGDALMVASEGSPRRPSPFLGESQDSVPTLSAQLVPAPAGSTTTVQVVEFESTKTKLTQTTVTNGSSTAVPTEALSQLQDEDDRRMDAQLQAATFNGVHRPPVLLGTPQPVAGVNWTSTTGPNSSTKPFESHQAEYDFLETYLDWRQVNWFDDAEQKLEEREKAKAAVEERERERVRLAAEQMVRTAQEKQRRDERLKAQKAAENNRLVVKTNWEYEARIAAEAAQEMASRVADMERRKAAEEAADAKRSSPIPLARASPMPQHHSSDAMRSPSISRFNGEPMSSRKRPRASLEQTSLRDVTPQRQPSSQNDTPQQHPPSRLLPEETSNGAKRQRLSSTPRPSHSGPAPCAATALSPTVKVESDPVAETSGADTGLELKDSMRAFAKRYGLKQRRACDLYFAISAPPNYEGLDLACQWFTRRKDGTYPFRPGPGTEDYDRLKRWIEKNAWSYDDDVIVLDGTPEAHAQIDQRRGKRAAWYRRQFLNEYGVFSVRDLEKRWPFL